MGQRSVRRAVLSWILLILVAAGIGWVTTHRQGSGERLSGSSGAVFDEGVTVTRADGSIPAR